MRISIIIINYNTSVHLRKCLNSIFEFVKKDGVEIIIVDNNSTDRNIEAFPLEFKDASFFFRDINDGFGNGCNYGAMVAKGKYLLFVNPDIFFEQDIPTMMYEFMERNTDIGACSPVFKNFDGKLVYTYNKFPSYKWEFFEFLGRGNAEYEKKLLSNEKIVNQSIEPLFVDWVTGACLMVREDIFKKLNGFDEDYFLYYEDTDLQLRIHNLGYNIVCLPFIRIKHFVNSSVRSIAGENIYYFHLNRSKMIFFYKNFSFLKRNILRLLIITGIFLRIGFLNFRTRYSKKKRLKMMQYKKMLSIYFSNKTQLEQLQYKA